MWEDAAVGVGASFSEPSPRLFAFARDGLVVHVLGQRTPFADPVSIELASAKDLSYAAARPRRRAHPGAHRRRRDDHEAARVVSRDRSGASRRQTGARGRGRPRRHAVDREPRRNSSGHCAAPASTSELLVVDRQAVGEQFRFLLLDGEVLDVIRRDRPQVVGDGTSTIEELMFAEYDRRVATDSSGGAKPFPVDLDCLFTLERQGLGLSTRPPKGTTVVVKSASNISGGRACVTVREPVAPEVVHEVRAAAAAVGVRLAGVDVVAPDVERSLTSSDGVVLEVNPIPGLGHHYNVAEPEAATPVAVLVLEALFAERAAAAQQA